jgi:hypothetical protein
MISGEAVTSSIENQNDKTGITVLPTRIEPEIQVRELVSF